MTTYSYVDLPLYSDYFYSYTVALEDNSYVVEVVYNQYATVWYMSLYTEDQEPIVQGIALVPEYPILADYVIPNLSGFFWLYPIPTMPSDKYAESPEALAQYFTLKYCYNFS